MNVLIDIEWIQGNDASSITQIAAVRVSDTWKALDIFSRLVRPVKSWDTDWEHMAYSGYSPDEFRTGVDEETCLSDLLRFLKGGDTLLCWHPDTMSLLQRKCEALTAKRFPLRCTYVNKRVRAMAAERGIAPHGLYDTAEQLGIITPAPRHRSINDVFVLRSLLSALDYSAAPAPAAADKAPKGKKDRRARNAEILSRIQYNYVFTSSSKVFHRPACRLLLSAKDINGCLRFETACKGRTPCKRCRPEPMEIRKQPERKAEPTEPPNPSKKKVVSAKLLGGQWIAITNVKIVGFCHNKLHPGKLTRQLMTQHDCLGKNCRFFEKYPDSSYWIAEENKQRAKEKRKEAQWNKKAEAQRLENEMTELKDRFQSCADSAGCAMLIVRIKKEKPNRYTVFYVSENAFADANRFPDLLAAVKFYFPKYAVQLRHIQDLDGHFMTIDEFRHIKR